MNSIRANLQFESPGQGGWMTVCVTMRVSWMESKPLIVMTQFDGPTFSHPSQSENASIQYAVSEARGPVPNCPTRCSLTSLDPSTLTPCFGRYTASWGGETGGKGSRGGETKRYWSSKYTLRSLTIGGLFTDSASLEGLGRSSNWMERVSN